MRNRYYIFEGPDKVGKSTITSMCKQWLHEHGIQAIVAPQPGATALGQKLREIVKHDKGIKIGTETEAMMFLLDHMAFVEEVLFQTDSWILSDRCDYISALVYQALRGVQLSRIDSFYSVIPTPKADAIFILQATPENLARRGGRAIKWDRYESYPEFMQKVHRAYDNIVNDHCGRLTNMLSDAGDLVTIDANLAIEEVFRQVQAVLEKHVQGD